MIITIKQVVMNSLIECGAMHIRKKENTQMYKTMSSLYRCFLPFICTVMVQKEFVVDTNSMFLKFMDYCTEEGIKEDRLLLKEYFDRCIELVIKENEEIEV